MFTIEYDDRERDAAQYFDTLSGRRQVQVRRLRLTTGDMAIWAGDQLKVLVERKQWDDLAASIKDGRLDAQLDGMQLVERETGCRLVLMVEGVARRQHGHIDIAALRAKLDRVLLAGSAHIIYTLTLSDTVQRVFDLADHLPDSVCQTFSETSKILTMTRERSDHQCRIDVLCALPDVSSNTAGVLIAAGFTPRRLSTASVQELAVLIYASGNQLGEARAQKIHTSVRTLVCWCRMLARVRGVTKKTAELICSALAPELWSTDALAVLAKTGKTRLGPVVAARIMHVLG